MWAVHGWVFMIYVVVAFLLARRAGWGLPFTGLVLVAGLVPLLIFWVERRVDRAAARRAPRARRHRILSRGPVTTAFVLGGGGVLGAVEVGMLRALFERGITPDLVLGTSVGALNGAMVARDPDPRRDRPAHRAVARPSAGPREVYGDRPLRTVRRAVSTGTHIYSSKPMRQRLQEEFGDQLIEDLPVRFQVCAAHIERAAEHWFDSGPLVDAVVASAAVPGLLPPARVDGEHYLDGGIVNSIPRRPGRAARRDPAVRAAGGPDRPAAAPCRAGRGRWPGCPSRSPVATGSSARWPSCPADVEAHVLPARGTSARDDTLLGHRDFGGVEQRIDATYDASLAYLDGAVSRGACGRCAGVVIAPAVMALTALIWVTLPAWLIVAAVLSPVLPGRWRALRLLWVVILYLTCEALLLLVLLGLWFSSGFGRRVRTPYFEGIHYDLVQGADVGVLPRGAAGAGAADRDRRPDPGRPPRRPDPGRLPPRRAGRLVHADPRADALVRTASRGSCSRTPSPGTRRSTWCSTGSRPGSSTPAAATSSTTSPSWPAASTRTTRS